MQEDASMKAFADLNSEWKKPGAMFEPSLIISKYVSLTLEKEALIVLGTAPRLTILKSSFTMLRI